MHVLIILYCYYIKAILTQLYIKVDAYKSTLYQTGSESNLSICSLKFLLTRVCNSFTTCVMSPPHCTSSRRDSSVSANHWSSHSNRVVHSSGRVCSLARAPTSSFRACLCASYLFFPFLFFLLFFPFFPSFLSILFF